MDMITDMDITMATTTTMGIELPLGRTLPELLYLLQFGDSALPVGGFSFSNGLESAIQEGLVDGPATLRTYTETSMWQAATSDGIAVLCAHRAAEAGDIETLTRIDKLTFERKLNEETRLMTVRMGRKLCELSSVITANDATRDWFERIKSGDTPGTHPVSLAITLAALHVRRQDAFGVQQYGVATAVLSAALRLMRISFIDTQKILLDVTAQVAPAYERVADATIDEMASFAPMIDILAAVHVKGHVRMFMN
ncbi:Urease accessory protein UreF 2 [Hyphomicrobiales bacterium]|nr:Urease accessory protein UreF 2 [Hyphomicrobiales bacterium]CAH1678922.1 Urease accessory protein UreF 2 [Hyphomicrobiales bacterium]